MLAKLKQQVTVKHIKVKWGSPMHEILSGLVLIWKTHKEPKKKKQCSD